MSAEVAYVTHSLCWPCWTQRHGDQTPARLTALRMITCCDCGDGHTSGIWARGVADPDEFPECECVIDDD